MDATLWYLVGYQGSANFWTVRFYVQISLLILKHLLHLIFTGSYWLPDAKRYQSAMAWLN